MDANVLNFLIIFGAGVGANISSAAITAAAQKIFGSRPARVARVARVGRNSAAYSAFRGHATSHLTRVPSAQPA